MSELIADIFGTVLLVLLCVIPIALSIYVVITLQKIAKRLDRIERRIGSASIDKDRGENSEKCNINNNSYVCESNNNDSDISLRR